MNYILLLGITIILASCSGFLNNSTKSSSLGNGHEKYDPDKPGRFASWYCNPDSLDSDDNQTTTIEEDNEIRREKEKWGANRTSCNNSFQENKYFEPSTLDNP